MLGLTFSHDKASRVGQLKACLVRFFFNFPWFILQTECRVHYPKLGTGGKWLKLLSFGSGGHHNDHTDWILSAVS